MGRRAPGIQQSLLHVRKGLRFAAIAVHERFLRLLLQKLKFLYHVRYAIEEKEIQFLIIFQ